MKLRKLILSGFKSFADRTEFDFDDGISCVVGPNGCGKSNVVDAFKWVLGEQSAKSLRGTEMMDVIFNGSSARKPAGMAEVTLVFDNSDGLLRIPNSGETTPQTAISVTRRLYRSGQSEYLINKLPSRLRDIREMFMDTGVGVDAYSVIEQGKVEVFLQSSQDDRRAIFDEAAGISKYKARKKEALRKLERVEQNLLRVTDIQAEVEKRLRSIKYQAGKARNYQEYSERLKDLRSLFFQAQYHTLSGSRTELQKKLDAATDNLGRITAMIEQLETARRGVEVESADLDGTARELQGRVGSVTGQISTRKERVEMLSSRVGELGQQIVAAVARCEELEAKIEAFDQAFNARREDLVRVEVQSTELAQKCEAVRIEHTSKEADITELADRLEDEKAGTIDLLRRTAQLHNEIQSHSIRRENLAGQQTRLSGRAEEIATALTALFEQRAAVEIKVAEVREVLTASQARLEEIKQAGKDLDATRQAAQTELGNHREQRSALQSRIQALREMQARREGVAAGVRNVLEAAQKNELPAIRGMLGDFLQSDVQHAQIVEAALAGADQSLLAARYDDLAAASEKITKILGGKGAVEVLCLDRLETFTQDFELASCPQINGRVMDWVTFDGDLAPLMWRLLGKTYAVATMADAAAAAAVAPRGSRFVTAGGEVLEADGRVRLGAANRGAGVIARRSEMVELEARVAQLDQKIEELQARCQTMRSEREHLEELQQKIRTAIYEANTIRVECVSRLGALNEQAGKLEREKPLVAEDLKNLALQVEQAVSREHQAREKAAELEALNAERQQEVARLTEEIAAARSRQAQLTAQLTEHKVALAQSQEKILSLKEAINSLSRQREQMANDITSGRSEIELSRHRRTEAEEGIKAAQVELERLSAEKETLEGELQDVEETRKGLFEKLEEIRRQLTAQRGEHDQASNKLNKNRVELSEADVRIENLISRASDEMQMNLLERFATYQHDEARDWAAVEAEIHDLKGKIERLGNVNLDAIAEQEELTQRQEFLGAQLEDVRTSQKQLADLIEKINQESRDLFLKTFEAVRANFQELFRKLFGGGRADIFLMTPEDVLESGIEVVARPPGKEMRSITLLSGGEKTMTALALLFSIFRSRPSPFCILDEVDAALDEANNRRFNLLVSEFIGTSQFLVISHAKRTMSMASVLYGVTMQEPGVSRRISVKFEDVGEKLEHDLKPAAAKS